MGKGDQFFQEEVSIPLQNDGGSDPADKNNYHIKNLIA